MIPAPLGSANSSTSLQPGPSSARATVDERQRTMEGFRSLGVISIFLAGLQAQMLTASLTNNGRLSDKLINAFWLAGIFLDVFAAVLAMLTARWFEMLDPADTKYLNETWIVEKQDLPDLDISRQHIRGRTIDSCIAFALFSSGGMVLIGVTMFVLGLQIFVWSKQPLLVSVIATIPVAAITPLFASCFVPHTGGKRNIILSLARKRGAW